ncbi:MAG: hypothetical protein KAI66_16510 [Lentisphaeria bacterium]|nr:hypothetical protein [Lentisphaeria bacterium]
MSFTQFDRRALDVRPLSERASKLFIERDQVCVGCEHRPLSARSAEVLCAVAERMRAARSAGRPVMMAFGAHTIKNGLGPVLIRLFEDGWIQHCATNGAGVIHDWEFAFQGKTSEDVRRYTDEGQFGIWEETGFHLNLALVLGACDGLGYGESIGRLIEGDGHEIPQREKLLQIIACAGESPEAAESAAAAADTLAVVDRFELPAGERLAVPHAWKRYSAQAAAYRLGIPFTAHPMIGHDIIYTHPLNQCAAIGRAAQRDFLAFAHNVSRLEGGVYLSVGSAVMSPMIFEKSLSMARNVARQRGERIDGHTICVVDLAESNWDWSQGEPPMDSPDYYLRYCKTFSRMGGTMHYATADNRDFLLALCDALGVK